MARSEHLSDDILALAAVDTSMLSREQKAHLTECEECRETLAGVEAGLGRISGCAKSIAVPPVPEMRSLAGKKSAKPFAYAAAAAVILVLAATWAFMPGTTPKTMVAVTESAVGAEVYATSFQDYVLGNSDATGFVSSNVKTTTNNESGTDIADTFYEYAAPMGSDDYLLTDLEETTWS